MRAPNVPHFHSNAEKRVETKPSGREKAVANLRHLFVCSCDGTENGCVFHLIYLRETSIIAWYCVLLPSFELLSFANVLMSLHLDVGWNPVSGLSTPISNGAINCWTHWTNSRNKFNFERISSHNLMKTFQLIKWTFLTREESCFQEICWNRFEPTRKRSAKMWVSSGVRKTNFTELLVYL